MFHVLSHGQTRAYTHLDYSLSLSTKAALYSGILSVDILALEPPCYTGNCTWPVFPTLAACGECVSKEASVSCLDRDEESCEYSVSANTVVTLPEGNNVDAFKVHPLRTSKKDSTNRTYLAEFEIIAASKRHSKVNTTAAECSLWACMMALDIHVMDGRVHQQTVSIWNNTRLENETNAHSTEYVFVDIPSSLNIQGNTRYSLSYRSVEALQSFMHFLTEGSYERAFEIVNFSSDWTEAMWVSISDLEAWMERLTLSLTNEFRRHGALRDAHNTAYEGDATRMASFVHVQWYWLIYMPLFLLLSLYYLFATIMAGVRDDVAIWKGDSMPMLFSCIHPDILTLGTGKMDTHKGLDDLGKYGIALGRDDTGIWTFEPTITPARAKRRFRRALRME